MSDSLSVAVVGAGAWGTALAALLATKGHDVTIWSYEADNEGIGIWVKATCKGCGRVEIFTTSGGKASGYARELRDLDRKHRDEHGLWLREQERGE